MSESNLRFKIEEVNSGFCRILYSVVIDKKKFYYCFQDDTCWNVKEMNFYRCGLPPFCEPSHITNFKDKNNWFNFEIPIGDSELELMTKDFILKKQGDK